ncbi:MAG: 3-phosphoshikimate 1-carboxyvinyltransferase, partial [Roseburia sp.]|nr:3-phosphoshikimate 1-carboxyvinyltransferase [Roseburia sp.]
TIQASEQMKKRPMKPLFDLLEGVGAEITYLEEEGFLPIRIRGCRSRREEGGMVLAEMTEALYLELDISKSTQFLSAMLLISPMVKQGLKIHITSEKTDGSYIRITRKMLEEAGVMVGFDGRDYTVPAGASYKKTYYRIEPDVSAACYFYGAAAITGGTALVKNVHFDNSQGDMKFLEVLRDMGCAVEEEPEGIRVTGPEVGKLKGIELNMNDFSDQALTLAAMAPYANSKVRMTGIGHIRGQESDRLHAMAAELGKAGICCAEEQSAITIFPGQPKAAVIETYEDHRVAMAFSLLGLRTEGIVIDNPGCCKKTFEEYFEILERLTEN